MNWSEALRLNCPRCGAQAAERCRGKNGERQSHHRERYGSNPIERPRRTRATRCNVDGYVYFIGPQGGGSVKIGWSKDDPTRRLKELQTGNGVELHLYGSMRGTQRSERALHLVFAHLRLRGEWFSLDGSLWDYILEVAA